MPGTRVPHHNWKHTASPQGGWGPPVDRRRACEGCYSSHRRGNLISGSRRRKRSSGSNGKKTGAQRNSCSHLKPSPPRCTQYPFASQSVCIMCWRGEGFFQGPGGVSTKVQASLHLRHLPRPIGRGCLHGGAAMCRGCLPLCWDGWSLPAFLVLGPAARLCPMTQTLACALGPLKRDWRAVAKAGTAQG